MNQLDILCFQISAKSKNFSLAAQELMISQQAVSKHIKNLESQLGFPLFLRNYQNVALTKAGELMLDYFSERQRLFDNINDAFVLSHNPDELKIICTEWLGNPVYFRNFIKSFQDRHPEISLFVYVLNHDKVVSMIRTIRPDYILTTSYNSIHLPMPHTIVSKFEVPLFIIGNKNINYSRENLSLFPYFTVNAGELGLQEIKRRIYRFCKPLDFTPSSVRIYDDIGSVFWNVLLQKGLTICPHFKAPGTDSAYSFTPLELSATAVLCRTGISESSSAVLFEEEFKNERITD